MQHAVTPLACHWPPQLSPCCTKTRKWARGGRKLGPLFLHANAPLGHMEPLANTCVQTPHHQHDMLMPQPQRAQAGLSAHARKHGSIIGPHTHMHRFRGRRPAWPGRQAAWSVWCSRWADGGHAALRPQSRMGLWCARCANELLTLIHPPRPRHLAIPCHTCASSPTCCAQCRKSIRTRVGQTKARAEAQAVQGIEWIKVESAAAATALYTPLAC